MRTKLKQLSKQRQDKIDAIKDPIQREVARRFMDKVSVAAIEMYMEVGFKIPGYDRTHKAMEKVFQIMIDEIHECERLANADPKSN